MDNRGSRHEMLSKAGTKSFLKTIEAYLSAPDDYVRTFTVRINGRKRHLITYKADEKGAALRYFHNHFAKAMSLCYSSCSNSYAYKRGRGIHSCLEQHLQSNTFLKSDIHEYFNSIDYEKLLNIILEDSACKKRPMHVARLLKACFYNGHLPIGFISSPVLSDLYLHKLDKQFLGREDIIYTRYADDFIISGRDNIDVLEQVKNELAHALSEYGLSLNRKKTYCRTLKKPGDAIHLLGLNLVNDGPNPNRITVSDRYIRDTSKDICQFMNECHEMEAEDKERELAVLHGKIEFIRHSSRSSYKKLERMVSVKSGKKVDLLLLDDAES